MDVSDYESEELFSEDTAIAPMNIDRKRVFCDHCQDYVDKSTFYRHQTLYINMNTSEPFDLANDESDTGSSEKSADTTANDHETGNFDEDFQEVIITILMLPIATYLIV